MVLSVNVINQIDNYYNLLKQITELRHRELRNSVTASPVIKLHFNDKHFPPYKFEQNIFEKLPFEELVFREKLHSSNFIFEQLISSNCIRGICRRRKTNKLKLFYFLATWLSCK
jgi:hypothetical protein